jgi:hypothetical protein
MIMQAGLEMTDDRQAWEMAQRIAKDKVAFLMHLAVYACVNAFFVGIWVFTGGPLHAAWFLFPASAWGIGLAIHFAAVYMGPGFEERQAQKEYARLGGQGPHPR